MADFLESEAEESEVSLMRNNACFVFDYEFRHIIFNYSLYFVIKYYYLYDQLDSEEDEKPAERKKPKRKAAVQSDDEEDDEGSCNYRVFYTYVLFTKEIMHSYKQLKRFSDVVI